MEVAKNALLPSLDVTGGWTQLGLESSFDESISEMASGRYYGWLAGVEFSVPLSNRGPRSLYRNARDEIGRLKYQKMQIENQIVLEVDQAIRKIESLRREASSLDERIRLQQELLQAERLKMEVGTSILYLVNVIANDLVDNVTQALRVKADLQIARAELLRATGTILDWHKIQVISD
jgi:outer membrane protein TolC